MSDVGQFEVTQGIGIITIDSPPVNALGIAVRKAIEAGLRKFAEDPAVHAIVLICGGRTFFAGADISEFGRPPEEPGLLPLLDGIESLAKPTVAAIHGTALGGGLETALVCNYRIAVPSAKVGLPEVALGLLPGAGGTQRLPRIVGATAALDLMLTGRPIGARQALDLGILDRLATEGSLRDDAVAFALEIVGAGAKRPLVRDREDRIAADRADPALFDKVRAQQARSARGFKAPGHIISAVEAAVTLPFDQGIARERELFGQLEDSGESAAQRYHFFAERESSKLPDVPSSTPVLPIATVGIIGAGTMGGGIAMNFLDVGLPVTLVETSQAALDRGLGVIRRNYEGSAAKGRITQAQVEQRMALIAPSLAIEDLATVDLVIEAVFESMPVKQDIFGKLDRIARPDAILASNTSFLDLDQIAAATASPQRVVGLHFFSPANVMKLLEIVRGEHTSKEVLATVLKLARRIGKIPVVSRVCNGFIANRAMFARSRESNQMVLEGTRVADIDRVIYDYGFAMGPFQMIDLVGLDVLGRDSDERTVMGDLVARGRLGQKQNGGYYDYDEKRRGTPSPIAEAVIADVAAAQGVAQRPTVDDEEILARLLYPVVNEGARILQEGIAARASDIDVALIAGYGWPVYTGGPMFWADSVGLPRIVARLREFESRHGEEFQPAALLVRLAEEGRGFADA